MLRCRRGRQLLTQTGAAAVEFAILLPVLMLVVGGVVDFGRAFFTKIELANAAREGARAAVVGVDPTGISDRVTASTPGLSVTVSTSSLCPTSAGQASVTVTVKDFQWIVLGPAVEFFGSSVPDEGLSSTAVMKCSG